MEAAGHETSAMAEDWVTINLLVNIQLPRPSAGSSVILKYTRLAKTWVKETFQLFFFAAVCMLCGASPHNHTSSVRVGFTALLQAEAWGNEIRQSGWRWTMSSSQLHMPWPFCSQGTGHTFVSQRESISKGLGDEALSVVIFKKFTAAARYQGAARLFFCEKYLA